MNKSYLRGDLYYADLSPGIGSEQTGRRPVVIIQNNTGNLHSPTVIVAAITSKVSAKAKLPTHCYVEAGNGLELPSVILLEQLRTVDKLRLENYIGRLSKAQMQRLNHALAVSVGLIQPFPQKLTLRLCSACADKLAGAGVYRLQTAQDRQPETGLCNCCNRHLGSDVELVLGGGMIP